MESTGVGRSHSENERRTADRDSGYPKVDGG